MDLETFRYYTDWHGAANARRYGAAADPRRRLAVDPSSVTHYTNALRLHWGLGRVQGGDWDRDENRHPIRETAIYRGLVERFEEGSEWRETALFERVRERFEDGETVRGYGSPGEFLSVRCRYLDDLYESIRREGYRPNATAGHDPADADNAFEDAYANHLEPLVCIARDGAVLWTEGYHRFSIASVLGLEAIPVCVFCRHADWQAVRERVAAEGSVPDGAPAGPDHPDLRDLLE